MAAAISDSGSITAMMSTPCSAASALALSRPALAAELHAITISFAPRSKQEASVPLDALREVVQAAGAVREARVVAEVEVVLFRQRDEELMEHREAADARVEHAYRRLG